MARAPRRSREAPPDRRSSSQGARPRTSGTRSARRASGPRRARLRRLAHAQHASARRRFRSHHATSKTRPRPSAHRAGRMRRRRGRTRTCATNTISVMGERHGSWGRILRVDLTSRTTSVEEMDEATFRRNPGGRAMIAHYLLKELPRGADPLGPENILVFAMGVLTGTPLSGASRHAVGAKSPLTDAFGEAEVGGFWGAELKRAGWDGIVVKGAATAPVYIYIRDDQVEIRDAAHLWGLEIMDTEDKLKAEVGERLARVCEIGPAGEKCVKIAGIVNDYKDIAGRAGLGAVMGSKKLKAIVVRGSKNLPLADAPKVKEIGRWVADTLQENHWAFHNFGTGMGLDGYTKVGGMAVRNYEGGPFDRAADISAEALVDKGYRIKMEACWACTVRCKKVVKLEQPYQIDPKYGGRAAERLGGKEFLTTVKGLEIAMHDPRQRTEYGKQVRISYATSPSGGDHLNANLPSRSARNTVGMCFFLKYDDPKLTDIVNAVTGWGITVAELAEIGERSLTLARLFNIREGFGADDDRLPGQVTKPHITGPLSKVRLDQDDLAGQIRAYYAARGWNEQGVPLPETLSRLQIAEYA